MGGLLLLLVKTRHESYFRSPIDSLILYDTSARHIKEWVPTFNQYDSVEIAQGLTLSREVMLINEQQTTLEKTTRIGRHLIASFHVYLGDPESFVFQQTPLQAYYSIKNRQTALYCTQFSELFTFFCRINHIITRRIESYGSNDRHTFNEVYLPETNEWVYVDLTYAILYITHHHHYVSLWQLHQALQSKTNATEMLVHTYINQHDSVVDLSLFSDTLRYNFDLAAQFLYHFEQAKTNNLWIEKIKNYLLSHAHYRYYAATPPNNRAVYIKYLTMLLLLGAGFYLLKQRKKK